MPYTFENLNVPHEPTTEDIRWMLSEDRTCEMLRNGTCQGAERCSSCIYSKSNSCSRKRFAMEKFPDMFFDGIYTWGIIPEASDVFMRRIGEVGCAELGRRHPSHREGGCRLNCTKCIFAVENSHARLGYYKKHHPNVKLCEICGNYHDNLIDYKGHQVCYECFNRGVSVCAVCGVVHPKRHLSRRNGVLVCDNCKALVEGGIHYYSFKPTPFFNKLENEENPIYFGIELEVGGALHSNTNKAARELSLMKNHYKNFYLKNDSSIPYSGFELVTHPCTYQYFKNEFPWDKVLSEIKFRGLSGCDGCGIHIHISRNALSLNTSGYCLTTSSILIRVDGRLSHAEEVPTTTTTLVDSTVDLLNTSTVECGIEADTVL